MIWGISNAVEDATAGKLNPSASVFRTNMALFLKDCPVHSKVFNNLCWLDAASEPQTKVMAMKNNLSYDQMSPGFKVITN